MLLHESIRGSAGRGAAKHRSMEALGQKAKIERRTKARYPIELQLHYHSLAKRNPINGTGRTLDMSSNGLLITSEVGVNPGAWLEISIQWPSELDGGIRLQLIAVGKVVRSAESNFAVEFHRYEFRTMRRTQQPDVEQDTQVSVTPTVIWNHRYSGNGAGAVSQLRYAPEPES
ncbi:MAG: PilZ domain-containing protein [Acidobacteriia bacterium]|nr:PilZ domain-containing protein [Terriglobia bacterium]